MTLSMVLILVVVVLTSSLGLYILAGRNSQAGTPSWCEGGVLLQEVKNYITGGMCWWPPACPTVTHYNV